MTEIKRAVRKAVAMGVRELVDKLNVNFSTAAKLGLFVDVDICRTRAITEPVAQVSLVVSIKQEVEP